MALRQGGVRRRFADWAGNERSNTVGVRGGVRIALGRRVLLSGIIMPDDAKTAVHHPCMASMEIDLELPDTTGGWLRGVCGPFRLSITVPPCEEIRQSGPCPSGFAGSF